MMVYDIFVRRKESLDQIRRGLKILGILDIITNNSESMTRYFVPSKQQLVPKDVIDRLLFEEDTSSDERSLITGAIESFDHAMLQKLLFYVSGTKLMLQLYPSKKINIKFKSTDAIVGGTCDFGLTLPSGVDDPVLMKAAVESIIDNKSQEEVSFNTY